ncbi:hypothetical protein [Sphaerisporangium perillae]|nr:hypothetical protein [Sphaerisporangium perillae]
MHRRRRDRFAAVMRDWPDHDRATFARLLTRFTDGMIQQPDHLDETG